MNDKENQTIKNIIEWVKQDGYREIKISGVEKGFLIELSEGEWRKDQSEIIGSIKRTVLASSIRRDFFDALSECYNSAQLFIKDRINELENKLTKLKN